MLKFKKTQFVYVLRNKASVRTTLTSFILSDLPLKITMKICSALYCKSGWCSRTHKQCRKNKENSESKFIKLLETEHCKNK